MKKIGGFLQTTSCNKSEVPFIYKNKLSERRKVMKKIGVLSTMLVAGCISLSTNRAEADWASLWNWGKGAYHGGAATQDVKRNNPFGAIDLLLRIPSPTNPYRYFPKPMQERIIRDFRMVDPAQRYGPEYRDLFR